MGLLDYTRILNQLDPKPDGEAPVRHRSAVVDAVNTGGTADIILSGIIVPGVSVLDGTAIAVGDTVQVVSWGGDLLVLGRTLEYAKGAPSESVVLTSESTASTSFGSLATVGPVVTVATGTQALVAVSCRMVGTAVGSRPTMGFSVTGASTIAANENYALQHEQNAGNDLFSGTYTRLITVTAGVNNFVAQYANLGGLGSATFAFRRVWVIPQ